MQTELAFERPRRDIIAQCELLLKRLLTGVGGLIHWLAAKSDLFVDALAEAAGKRTGKLIINGRSKFGDSQTARHRHSGGCLSDWTMASASISEILNLRPRS
jgi:hypothetical protein